MGESEYICDSYLWLQVASAAQPPWTASVGHLCHCMGFSASLNHELFLFWTAFEDLLLFLHSFALSDNFLGLFQGKLGQLQAF